MPPDSPQTVALACHPETPTDAVHGIAVRVRREARGKLSVAYVVEGKLDRVRVPELRAPRFVNELWRHTCCEIFVGPRGSPAYYEFNLSPSGEWAAYAFDGYRARRAAESQAPGLAPQLAVRDATGRLELDAIIRLDRLPGLHAGAPLSLALSAVIEDRDGVLSYWALRHPRGKPDFHHPAGFALELAGAGG